MITQQSLHGAQYRLAHHYVTKLQRANMATQRGHEYRTHWLRLIDKDWAQIKHWQDWSTAWTDQEVEKATFCVAFATVGRDILTVRQTAIESIAWLQPALQAARKLGNGLAERNILAALGHAYYLTANYDEAYRHLQYLVHIADRAQDEFNVGRAYVTLGNIAAQQGKLDEAEADFQKSLAIFERLGDTIHIGRALHKLGQIAHFRGNYQQAYKYHTQYLSLVDGTGREADLAVALDSLSHCLVAMRDFKRAKDYAQRVVDICRRIEYTTMLPAALFSLGSCEIELETFDASYAHYEEGVQIARAINHPSYCIHGLDNMGYIHSRKGEYPKAIACFNEALALSYTNQIPLYITIVQQDLANTHIMLGDLDAARAALHEALRGAVTLGTERHKAKILVTAVLLWQRLGETTQSAVWAGLLMQYTQHLDPSLFELVCLELEHELGTRQYNNALEQGKALTLDAVIEVVLHQIG